MRTALITGVTGQDGTLLAELLHAEGTHVIGVARGEGTARVRAAAAIERVDVRDAAALEALVRRAQPDEVYHLAAHHGSSQADRAEDDERLSLDVNAGATLALLGAVKRHRAAARVFVASSCRVFGDAPPPQDESTPLAPRTIYGITKSAAQGFVRMYRERHGLFCAAGILYNHESPLRGPGYVTARLARAAAEARRGSRAKTRIGSLASAVDWGFAGDYVEAMRRMLRADAPEDFVIASGVLRTVRQFAEAAFSHVGLRYEDFLEEDPAAFRAPEGVYQGNIARIRKRLGWEPRRRFEDWVAEMVDAA